MEIKKPELVNLSLSITRIRYNKFFGEKKSLKGQEKQTRNLSSKPTKQWAVQPAVDDGPSNSFECMTVPFFGRGGSFQLSRHNIIISHGLSHTDF